VNLSLMHPYLGSRKNVIYLGTGLELVYDKQLWLGQSGSNG